MKIARIRKLVMAGVGVAAMLAATFFGVSQEEVSKNAVLIADGVIGLLLMFGVYQAKNDTD